MGTDIQQIKARVGQDAREIIAHGLGLERKGSKYRCPDKFAHRNGDRDPSMSWDGKLLRFKCFTCGKTVDIYDHYKGLGYSHGEIVAEILGKDNVKETSMAKSWVNLESHAQELAQITQTEIDYLHSRKIENATIEAFGLMDYKGSIAFPYRQNGVMVGCKTRKPQVHVDGPKYLSLPGSKPGLYNFDNVDPDQPLVICEGELDAMIVWQSGFHNVVSVGAGANSCKSLSDQYKSFLDAFPYLIIFSDNDDSGANMDKAFLEAFPDKARLVDKAVIQNKDANEEYFVGGADAIKKVIESAYERIEGLYNPDTDETPITEVFARGRFIPTGLPSIDHAINDLAPGCVTLIAGRSSGGKSTIITQVIANAIQHDNKVFLVSGEDEKRLLINKIYTAVIGWNTQLYDYVRINKRMFKVPKKEILADLKTWHRDRLHLFMKGESKLKTIDTLFDLISRKIRTDRYNLIVIDNIMSVLDTRSVAEKYEDQADFVQRCCDIAKLYHVHILIVLHPNKSYRKGMDLEFEMISGSSDMANKSDNILAVTREYDADKIAQGINGYCEVLKNRYFTDLKKVLLHFDKETGMLLEMNAESGAWFQYRFDLQRKSGAAIPEPLPTEGDRARDDQDDLWGDISHIDQRLAK